MMRDLATRVLLVASILAIGAAGAIPHPRMVIFSAYIDPRSAVSAALVSLITYAVAGGVPLRFMLPQKQRNDGSSGFLLGAGVGGLSGAVGLFITSLILAFVHGLPQVGRPALADAFAVIGYFLLVYPLLIAAGGWWILLATAAIGSLVGLVNQRRQRRRHGRMHHGDGNAI